MGSPRRTHIAASVAYAALAATMAGVLLSSARVLPELELPSLHLSSGAHHAGGPLTQPAPSRARTANRSPAATAQPAAGRPATSPPLAGSSTRTCDATDFDCLVAGASSPEPTRGGPTGTPAVVVKFVPSQPASPGAGSRTSRPQDQATGPAVVTSSDGTPAGTATAAPTTEVPTAAPTETGGPPAATPTDMPTTPTATPTPTDGPVEAPVTPAPAGTAGGSPTGP